MQIQELELYNMYMYMYMWIGFCCIVGSGDKAMDAVGSPSWRLNHLNGIQLHIVPLVCSVRVHVCV